LFLKEDYRINSIKEIAMSEQLKITLIKSMIGKPEKLKVVLKGLGLTKLKKTVVLNDTPEIQGMIRKVAHLVSVAK